MRLNLGCSDDIRVGWINVDLVAPLCDPNTIFAELIEKHFHACDLSERWPWPTSSVDEIVAHDVFEHLDNETHRGQRGIIWCMNEAWRVLRPGGRLDLAVPCLPGVAPFVDPTHVSFWTADLRYYFTEPWNNPKGERGRLGPSYGIDALFRTVGGRSGPDWTPIQYAADAPDRRKLLLILEAIK